MPEPPHSVDVVPLGPERLHVLQNLYLPFQHDLAEFQSIRPNRFGLYDDDEDLEQYDRETWLAYWLQEPEALWPYLFEVDGRPVGFATVATGERVGFPEADRVIWDYFVVRTSRGDGTAQAAAREVFATFYGTWQLEVLAGNERAKRFWRRIVGSCFGEVSESTKESADGDAMIVLTARP